MTIQEAREKVGLTRKQLCEWLEIPYRTLQNWEIGVRACPPYMEKLIVEKIINEKGSN
ncbi:MAG: helix-turn-helix domain-containing protein [Lachnospiraceae bacterium]|nr:helix-turn-helix domain-containing protein [Lachnospiraceae bacterium]